MSGLHDAAKAVGIRDEHAKALFDQILNQVKEQGRVVIPHFGTFSIRHSAARTIISPQLPKGQAEVPERNILRFHASISSREVLNQETGKAKGTPTPIERKNAAPEKKAKVKVGHKTVAHAAPVAKAAAAKVPARKAHEDVDQNEEQDTASP